MTRTLQHEAIDDIVDLAVNPSLEGFSDPIGEIARRVMAIVTPFVDRDGPIRERLEQQIVEGLRRADRNRVRFLLPAERGALITCLTRVREARGLLNERDEFDPDEWLIRTFFEIEAADYFDDPSVVWATVFDALLHPQAVAVAAQSPKAAESLQALINELVEDGRDDQAERLHRAYGYPLPMSIAPAMAIGR